MPLHKLGLFAVLAVVLSFASAENFDIQTTGPYLLAPNSPHGFLPVQSKNPKDLGAGKLLVAGRDIADPNFAQTVVLLVHCDAKGVVGLILNRRTNVPLSRMFEQLKTAKNGSDPVYLGGPVEGPAAFALLQSVAKVEGAEEVFGEVYFISTKTLFEKTISTQPGPDAFHVYMGYAGWGYAQLQKEVQLGAWFIFPSDTRTVFDSDPDSLWRQMIQKTEFKVAGVLPESSAYDEVSTESAPSR
jgi:putative AlgH/UPF0301 family transcriptional regulator